MATHYGPPFRLWYVRNPATGKLHRIVGRAEAARLAKDLGAANGVPPETLLSESPSYFALEYGGRWTRRISTGCRTKFEAAEFCRSRLREARGPVTKARQDLGAALDEWLAELEAEGRRPKTLRDYRVQTRFWREHFKGKTVSEIRRRELLEFFRTRRNMRGKVSDESTAHAGERKKPSPRLLNLNVVLWRAFLRWCMGKDRRYVESNPAEDIKLWDEPEREPRIFSPEELACLLRACTEPYALSVTRGEFRPYSAKQEFTPPASLYPVVVCGLTTLLRLSNVLNLRWNEVDLEAGVIRIAPVKVKTNRELVVPVGKRLRACLLALPKTGADQAVFGGQKEIKRAFNNALRRARIAGRGASFHALRRTGATHLLSSGVLKEVVQALGGWKKSGGVMMASYRHVLLGEMRRAVELLDELVAPKSEKRTSDSADSVS